MIAYNDRQSWNGDDYLDGSSWADALVSKSANDSVTVVVTEQSVKFLSVSDQIATALVESSGVSALTFASATDTIVATGLETRAQIDLSGQQNFGAVETLQLTSVESAVVGVVSDVKFAVDQLVLTLTPVVSVSDVSGYLFYVDLQSWQVGIGYTDHDSWGVGSVTSASSSDSVVGVLTETSLVTLVRDTITDNTVPVFTEAASIFAIGTTPKVGVDVVTCAFVETDIVVPLTEVQTTDEITIGTYENRSILGSGTTIGASDTLAVNGVESLFQAQTVWTDDAVTPEFTEVGSTPFNTILAKTASDNLVVTCSELFEIGVFGASYPSATDSVAVLVSDNAKALFQYILKESSDSIVVSGVETTQLVRHEVRSGTDGIVPLFGFEEQRVLAFVPPPEGELPPGWYSVEEEERVGIIEPWLTDPSKTTFPTGWFTRRYWAVYDTNARLRATDAVRSAAHAQGWTRYSVGDKRGKVDIT